MSGFAALLTMVGAFATDMQVFSTTNSFPVGNEKFFRTEGVALVRGIFLTYAINSNVDATPLVRIHDADGYAGWSTITTSQNGTSHDINLDGSWTEAQLFEQAKKGLTTFLGSIKRAANIRYAIQVDWGGRANEVLGPATFFRKMINFTLEKGSDGSWHAPAGITETLAMNFADNVFLRTANVVNARLRWWNGKEFNDSAPYSNISLTGIRKASSFEPGPYTVFVDVAGGVIALPAEPILRKSLGILTLELADRSIVRYSTSTGSQLPGKQEKREPLILAIEYTTQNYSAPTAVIHMHGEGTTPEGEWDATIEKSSDFKSWIALPNGVSAENVVAPSVFYRARYK